MSQGPILVTGGAGYIGSHVCHALKQRGYTPITLDNLSRGHRAAAKFGPLIEGNIGDSALIQKICAEYKPIAAMHFAALIEVGESVRFPDLFMDNNTAKAKKLFETLQTDGVNKVVFSSTAAVYGMPDRPGVIAEDWPLKPINPYGESKLQAEQHLRNIQGMRSVALRYFNAAGALPEQELGEAHWPESHLVPNALLAVLGHKAEGLTIFGQDYPTSDGTAVRDYIHVLDLAEAHILALEYLLKGGGNTAINLGTGTGISVKEIVDTIAAVTGKPVPLTYGARRPGDSAFLVADNQKAKTTLNWQPKLGLREIIASAHAWHASPLYRKLVGLA
ncbi:MAG: UDP-glucose 4-epimerase GalE [Alphaproteobacteria bacterium]|nr:UDP-glucose 4-epimerase GalE [Alphaproteobacteria bacterium]